MPCWDTTPFQAFHRAIEDALADPLVVDITTAAMLQEIFDSVSSDLSKVLEAPKKNLEIRNKLRTGISLIIFIYELSLMLLNGHSNIFV